MVNDSGYTSALQDLDTGRFSSPRAAAAAYGVNPGNLSRRRRGQRNHVDSHEEQQTLTFLQEQMLVRWIIEAEQAGHAFNHAQLKDMAIIISKASGGRSRVGKHWATRFLQRHPEIHTKKGVTIASKRVYSFQSTEFTTWLSHLSSLMKAKGIVPANI